jgi:hypothetical protein
MLPIAFSLFFLTGIGSVAEFDVIKSPTAPCKNMLAGTAVRLQMPWVAPGPIPLQQLLVIDTFDFSAFTTGVNINIGGTTATPVSGTSASWNSGRIEDLISASESDSLTGSIADNLQYESVDGRLLGGFKAICASRRCSLLSVWWTLYQ